MNITRYTNHSPQVPIPHFEVLVWLDGGGKGGVGRIGEGQSGRGRGRVGDQGGASTKLTRGEGRLPPPSYEQNYTRVKTLPPLALR